MFRIVECMSQSQLTKGCLGTELAQHSRILGSEIWNNYALGEHNSLEIERNSRVIRRVLETESERKKEFSRILAREAERERREAQSRAEMEEHINRKVREALRALGHGDAPIWGKEIRTEVTECAKEKRDLKEAEAQAERAADLEALKLEAQAGMAVELENKTQ